MRNPVKARASPASLPLPHLPLSCYYEVISGVPSSCVLYYLSLVEGTLVGGREGSLWEVAVFQIEVHPVVC